MVWKGKDRDREENLSLYVSFRGEKRKKEGKKEKRAGGVEGGEKKNRKLLRKPAGEKLEFSLDSF